MKRSLPCFFCLQKRRHRAVFLEDLVRVFHADDLVVLHEVEPIGLETGERFLDLTHRGFFSCGHPLWSFEKPCRGNRP